MPNTIQKRPDGIYEGVGELGEQFTGATPEEFAQKILDAQQNTKKWAQEQKEKAERLEREVTDLKARQNQPTTTTTSAKLTDEEKQASEWMWNTMGKSLGLPDGQSLIGILNTQAEEIGKLRFQRAVADFNLKCPDFPNTNEASDKLIDYVNDNYLKQRGLDIDRLATQDPAQATALLEAAHAQCIRTGAYKALSESEQTAQWSENLRSDNRAKAAPMISSRAADAKTKDDNPYAMNLDDLRARAIKEQLEGRG